MKLRDNLTDEQLVEKGLGIVEAGSTKIYGYKVDNGTWLEFGKDRNYLGIHNYSLLEQEITKDLEKKGIKELKEKGILE